EPGTAVDRTIDADVGWVEDQPIVAAAKRDRGTATADDRAGIGQRVVRNANEIDANPRSADDRPIIGDDASKTIDVDAVAVTRDQRAGVVGDRAAIVQRDADRA